MKFMALDIGKKRIGIACCDKLEIAAYPHSVIPADESAPQKIAKLIETEEIDGVIVGMPVSLSGSVGEACKMAENFVAKLKPLIRVPLETIDERLTSKIAENALIEGKMRREKRKLVRDAVAAALILKTFLDRRKVQL